MAMRCELHIELLCLSEGILAEMSVDVLGQRGRTAGPLMTDHTVLRQRSESGVR